MNITVADLTIDIESADKPYFAERYRAYESAAVAEPMMRMRTRLADPVSPPAGTPVQQIKQVQITRLPDGRTERCCVGSRSGQRLFKVTATPAYDDVDIELWANRQHDVLTQTDWEYMYTGAMFNNRLMKLGGGVLHSSAIAYKGQGVAFSADPGTGKSTHTSLWKERFGDDVQFVNDDKPAIRFVDGQAMMYGTPWSGKTALNNNLRVPLRAIVFIERGEHNSIRTLTPIESMFQLTSQIARPYYDTDIGIKAVDFAEKLLANVPIYMLTCNISQRAVEVAFDAVFSGGI